MPGFEGGKLDGAYGGVGGEAEEERDCEVGMGRELRSEWVDTASGKGAIKVG